MLIALAIWGDMATHMSWKVLERRRVGMLRNHFRRLNSDIHGNRTALLHVVGEYVRTTRNQLSDAFLRATFQHLYLSWPFWVAIVAECLLFIATLLYLARKDFKVTQKTFAV